MDHAMKLPKEIMPCRVCHEDLAYLEHENGWCVYVYCPNCGSQSAFCSYESEEEKEDAENRAIDLWNMGKVIAERRGE